ncbi:hypothetical protein DMH04_28345 [Kibdelosporangium aridum]|uniref:PH domain-containing protein n=1 Tax=Kibdelosporangium aridum TaxID=2030 RepID=A0A428Z4I9_KIBAR|nr:hypothetical protein [Kibdelosporangium aridum]RSM81303.1 hypothetical protein DMH04_28345 [Kibdelosporangium aridum]
MQPLGGLVSVHPVANGRRWLAALIYLLAAAVPAGVFAVLIVFSIVGPGFGRVGAFLLIPVIVVLPVALFQLAKALYGGFAESYEVYERGFAHVRWGRRRSWAWDVVYGLDPREKGGNRRYGWDFSCAVSFHGGSRLIFTGLTRDARQLAETLNSRCPEARRVDFGVGWVDDVLPWATPVAAVGLGWLTWWAIDTMITNDEQTDSLSPHYVEGVQQLSEGAIGGLSMVVLFCGLGAIAAAVAFIWVMVDRLR